MYVMRCSHTATFDKCVGDFIIIYLHAIHVRRTEREKNVETQYLRINARTSHLQQVID